MKLRFALFKTLLPLQKSVPAVLFVGLLIILGIDYRRHGFGSSIGFGSRDETYRKWYEPRTEETVEKWQKVGGAIGASGALLMAKRPRPGYIRRLSMFMGITLMGASLTNNFSNILA